MFFLFIYAATSFFKCCSYIWLHIVFLLTYLYLGIPINIFSSRYSGHIDTATGVHKPTALYITMINKTPSYLLNVPFVHCLVSSEQQNNNITYQCVIIHCWVKYTVCHNQYQQLFLTTLHKEDNAVW